MAGPLVIWTYDWVPEAPRGLVRDLRLRWACEEAGFDYEVKTVPFDGRETNHLAQQPFGQVPMLDDGDLHLFESGACLMHLAQRSEALMPRDDAARAKVLQWVMVSLNSIEMVTMPWVVLKWSKADQPPITQWLDKRLAQVEAVLQERSYLVGDAFTVADLLLADVLRVDLVRKHGDRPASEAYVQRITARPAFARARSDQLAHFAAADGQRKEACHDDQ